MKKTKTIHKKIKTTGNHIKVKLDEKTFIMIQKISSLAAWKLRYPNARVIT